MEEITENFGDGIKAALSTIAVLAIMGGALYVVLQSSIVAYVSGLF